MSTTAFRAENRSGGPPLPTPEEVADAGRLGWNLRCNRCGGWGARWVPNERPGWGALALCDPHADELEAEHRRHAAALAALRPVNFEQPRPAVDYDWLVKHRREAGR